MSMLPCLLSCCYALMLTSFVCKPFWLMLDCDIMAVMKVSSISVRVATAAVAAAFLDFVLLSLLLLPHA